jgi:hypothetical protein
MMAGTDGAPVGEVNDVSRLLDTLALIAAGTGSAGGLATSVVWKLRAKPADKRLVGIESTETPSGKEEVQ